MRRWSSQLRRAVTLIEAVVVVVVIAIAVPPMLTVSHAVAGSRAESSRVSVATSLAQGVMEQILADMSEEDGAPGFGALADADAYLSTPDAGLINRVEWLTEHYSERWGMTVTVEIGDLISVDGSVTGDVSRDIYREVAVVVDIPGETGRFEMRVAALVGGAQ